MSLAHPIVRPPQAHAHVSGPNCPTCDQPIASEKADQVRARIETRERQLSESVGARLKEQFARERQQLETSALATVEKLRKESAASIEAIRNEALRKEAAAREEATVASQEAARELVAQADLERRTVLERYEALRSDHDTIVEQRVEEAREALEAARTEAVNALKMEHFEEKQRLTGKLEELTRRLERKSAEERGDASEVDLFEGLRQAFPGDSVRRVEKGAAGADIIHDVLHNSRECGRILYEAKN